MRSRSVTPTGRLYGSHHPLSRKNSNSAHYGECVGENTEAKKDLVRVGIIQETEEKTVETVFASGVAFCTNRSLLPSGNDPPGNGMKVALGQRDLAC